MSSMIDVANSARDSAVGFALQTGAAVRRPLLLADFDGKLLLVILTLMGIGLVMVASASMPVAERDMSTPLYYLLRQGMYIVAGIGLGLLVVRVPVLSWQQAGPYLLLLTIFMLCLVLVPGVGRQVNGAVRWIAAGPIKIQVSELAKLFVIVYMAGYLVRHGQEVRERFSGFFKPMALIMLICMLLMMEPDFGSTFVIISLTLSLLFLAGVKLRIFAPLVLIVGVVLALLIRFEPYRWARMTSFMDPWQDPFDSGFQLAQSLIAIGRGDWFGVGLGNSMQKLLYLPEAHTDFVFAVYAEEMGFIGTLLMIALFLFVIWRAFQIGKASERVGRLFGAYSAYGIGMWLGLQAYINLGVSMGALPTKGLTLPLVSYGGSSMLVTCISVAFLLRIDYERRMLERPVRTAGGGRRAISAGGEL